MSSDQIEAILLLFGGLALIGFAALVANDYQKTQQARRDKYHETMDEWQTRRRVDAAEREDGDE